MFASLRRRVALMICPELAAFDAKSAVRPVISTEHAERRQANADRVRAVAWPYLAVSELPVWRQNRTWLEAAGVDWGAFTEAKASILRAVRSPYSTTRPETADHALWLLSIIYPPGLAWPPSIPRPKTKEAA